MTPGGSSLDNIFALLPCCQRKICRFSQSTVLLRFHWRVLITSPSGHFVLDGRESRLFVFQISPLRHLPLSTCFPTSIWPFFLELSFPFCYNWWCHCKGLEELKLCFCHHPTFCTVSVLGVPRTQMENALGRWKICIKQKRYHQHHHHHTITITVTIKTTYIGPIGRTAVTFTHKEWDAQKQCYLDR